MNQLLEKALAHQFVKKLACRLWRCHVCGGEGTSSYTIEHGRGCPLAQEA